VKNLTKQKKQTKKESNKNNMYTRTNARNKTNFVGHNTAGVEIYLSTPLAKAKKASRLTLRSGKTRVDLDGRQIKALREVLNAGYSAVGTVIDHAVPAQSAQVKSIAVKTGRTMVASRKA
jgi:hypothetical protein